MMPPDDAGHFADRHGLWERSRAEAALAVEARVREDDVKVIRFSFADQHGLLRGKTLVASELARALRSGVGCPSSLLLKDTAHRTVFSAYTEGGGVGLAQMANAADVLMIPDPHTFRVLPWAPHTGWMLCDLRFPDGGEVPFSTRDLYRRVLGRLGERGMAFVAGTELEFHLFRLTDPHLAPEDSGQPGTPPDVALTTRGFQYLTEERYDELDPICEQLRMALQGLGLPLRSLEVEFGPSQCEMTFGPGSGLAPADLATLARAAIRQVARRHGHHATFMCRPRIPNVVSSGWHLHQSLCAPDGRNLFVSDEPNETLSPTGRAWLGGLLAHAGAATAFSTPTINGYKRYRPFSNAPDRAIWGRDNRGAMVRVMGGAGDPATRLENRVGEPAANAYLYLASQIIAGLDGIDRKRDPGPASETPYAAEAPVLPRSLDEALAALDGSACFRAGFGDAFVDYWLHIKRAEIARYQAEVSDWEQREYFATF
jgi:glutamine synthetase